MNNNVTIRVQELMQFYGCDQKTLAENIGLDRTTINRYMKDKQVWSDKTLNKIASAFKSNYRWLKTGEGSMFEEPQGAGTAYLGGKGMGNLIDDARAKTIMQQLGGHHNSQTAESAKEDRQAEIELLKKMVADKDKEIEFLRQMLAKTK